MLGHGARGGSCPGGERVSWGLPAPRLSDGRPCHTGAPSPNGKQSASIHLTCRLCGDGSISRSPHSHLSALISSSAQRFTPQPVAPRFLDTISPSPPRLPSCSPLHAVAAARPCHVPWPQPSPSPRCDLDPSTSPPVTRCGLCHTAPSVVLTTPQSTSSPSHSAPPRPPSPGSISNRFSGVKQSRVIYQQISGPSEAGSGRAQRWRQALALIKFPSSAMMNVE